jgi:phosphoketolase
MIGTIHSSTAPMKRSHVKPKLLGRWGTTPGQNFIYVHLKTVVMRYDLDMFFIGTLDNYLRADDMTTRRMVLVAAGGHGTFGTTLGDPVVANWTVSYC